MSRTATLSGGRIIIGIGVGGPPHSNPASYEVMGVKLSERGARTDESLARKCHQVVEDS